MKSVKGKITLIDRLAFAFFGAVSAFVTGALIYAVVAYVITEFNNGVLPPFYPVFVFTVSMSVLGFVTANDYIFKILMGLWRLLGNVGNGIGP
ncbi:hypothetical protein [Marinobacter salarius]|uniref:Uncharacterized protein n=1 Tax=Marinobacter salarius TaxID=1420917 RepID=A0A1W6KF19_9GAMM|nr:hypothetical protein [Marinobacter salarius]ARM86034.1 hypothetical protein MARSALSMR5_04014 [Marinobacter salarius]